MSKYWLCDICSGIVRFDLTRFTFDLENLYYNYIIIVTIIIIIIIFIIIIFVIILITIIYSIDNIKFSDISPPHFLGFFFFA